jgi:hypothetical protein
MDLSEALHKLLENSAVTIQSSAYLVDKVKNRAKKVERDQKANNLPIHVRKPKLIPVPKSEHGGQMSVTPWELLHLLGRATILSGHGSSRALAQHWGCLRYITTLQANSQGRMELSPDGRDPRYHRKSVQAEDLGISFALAAALRIVQARHPGYKFEIADADVALEAGWALRGAEVRSRPQTRLRPDYFLVGLRGDEPARIVTVECKGSHGRPEAQHIQLAKAAAQVNAVFIGDKDKGEVPPSLMLATSLASQGGIEMRILDPEGTGVLSLPDEAPLDLNGQVEQFNEAPGIPAKTVDGRQDTRPGFYIPPQRSEWFTRVLTRTAAASLLTFIGDRTTALQFLTERQQRRVGVRYNSPGTDAVFDAQIRLGELTLIGTDHVFRFGSHRMEAFSGTLRTLYEILASGDLAGYQSALPQALAAWGQRQDAIQEQWGGVIQIDTSGAVLGLRAVTEDTAKIEYP